MAACLVSVQLLWGLQQANKCDFACVFRTAVSAADAQQNSEISDLQTVVSLANETLFDLINATITANYSAQLDTLDSTYNDNTSDVSDSTFSACCCVTAMEILV